MRGFKSTAQIFLALICSFLLVLQPVFGAPESLAIAKLTGNADRNGQPLLNGSVVSSGDTLATHSNSALLLTPTPQERLWLGPDSEATVSTENGTVVVSIARGTMAFRTHGHMQVQIQNHPDLALRARTESPVVAQLSLINNQQAQVRVQQGSLEMVEAGRTVLLTPEQPPRSSPGAKTAATPDEQGQAATSTGSVVGAIVDTQMFVVAGATVTLTSATGQTLTATSDSGGKFAFNDVAPGNYTLRVTKSKFQTYELKDVAVSSGNESSIFVHLTGGTAKGGGGNGNSLLLWVVVGGAAAAGIGAYAATRGSSTPSPSQ